ncbi:hypothetical protein KFK09_016130 [Dendrobium nobile]|uniref:Uncharacterized protein n=1 Tax=Dendrobium nobile TaxID=94219 RepID=A0A8T3AYH6_DENNO|nr:hypothetical protein KFK09_016130 [Dendrobium nobile]
MKSTELFGTFWSSTRKPTSQLRTAPRPSRPHVHPSTSFPVLAGSPPQVPFSPTSPNKPFLKFPSPIQLIQQPHELSQKLPDPTIFQISTVSHKPSSPSTYTCLKTGPHPSQLLFSRKSHCLLPPNLPSISSPSSSHLHLSQNSIRLHVTHSCLYCI